MTLDIDFAQGLIACYGSPLYVYDLERVEQQARTLQAILPPGSALFYSLKANPLRIIASTLRELGCWAEVSSTGEVAVTREAGFEPDCILYTGPGKTPEEIQAAVISGLQFFSCESWIELERLENTARKTGVKLKVLLRINPNKAPGALLPMTGVPSQFGFEVDQLVEGWSEAQRWIEHLEIVGLHIYHGTQINTVDSLASTFREAIAVAEHLSEALAHQFHILDVGGGFPWPYAHEQPPVDLASLKFAFAQIAAERRQTALAELWFESGRYLSAASGTLLTSVVDVKISKERKKYVVLDTGIHHLGGMSGLGRIPRSNLTIQVLSKKPAEALEKVDLVGPLCTPLDCLAREIVVPCLQPGDVLAIPNVGAYGLTASLVHFLSRPAPMEIAYRDARCVEVYQLNTRQERLPVQAMA
jgi:diaminopimelate decarboxylase